MERQLARGRDGPGQAATRAVGVPRAVLLPATVPVRIDRFELTADEHPPVKLVESLGLNSWPLTVAFHNRSGERLAVSTYPCAITPPFAAFPRLGLERIVRRAW